MPDARLRHIETLIPRLAETKAPIDLLPKQKIGRVQPFDLAVAAGRDKEGAATSISNRSHRLILFIEVRYSASFMVTTQRLPIDRASCMPEDCRLVVIKNLGSKNGRLRMLASC